MTIIFDFRIRVLKYKLIYKVHHVAHVKKQCFDYSNDNNCVAFMLCYNLDLRKCLKPYLKFNRDVLLKYEYGALYKPPLGRNPNNVDQHQIQVYPRKCYGLSKVNWWLSFLHNDRIIPSFIIFGPLEGHEGSQFGLCLCPHLVIGYYAQNCLDITLRKYLSHFFIPDCRTEFFVDNRNISGLSGNSLSIKIRWNSRELNANKGPWRMTGVEKQFD